MDSPSIRFSLLMFCLKFLISNLMHLISSSFGIWQVFCSSTYETMPISAFQHIEQITTRERGGRMQSKKQVDLLQGAIVLCVIVIGMLGITSSKGEASMGTLGGLHEVKYF